MRNLLVLFLLAFSIPVFATPSPLPVPETTPSASALSSVAAVGQSILEGSDVSVPSLVSDVATVASKFGGLSWSLRIASIVLLLLALVKCSRLNPLWDKLGSFKAIAAPVLGLLGGCAYLLYSGHFSLAGVLAYAASGAGALGLHEVLDMVKAIPGLGALWVGLIDAVEGALGAPGSTK